MLMRRFTYLLTWVVLAILWILSDQMVFGLLLIALGLMTLLSFVLFLIASSSPDAVISAPESVQKTEAVRVKIRLQGNSLLSIMELQPRGYIENLLTGERLILDSFLPDSEKKELSFELTLKEECCGKISIILEQILIRDPLGIFSRSQRLDTTAATLITPDTFRILVELQTPNLPDIESTDYSPHYAGDDPSELFGIRDYREGDPLRSIHWKLSEKYDRTVVREMSLPVAHSILLLFDNIPSETVEPIQISDAAEALISLSQSLCEEDIPHQIAWFDRENAMLRMEPVGNLEDLYGIQSLLLSTGTGPSGSGIVSAILEHETMEYSHLLLFAPALPEGTDILTNTTLLLPQAEPLQGVSCLREQLETILL